MRTTDPAQRFARLQAFLERLRADIYPEPPTPGHSKITAQAFEAVQGRYPFAPGARVLDIGCGQGVALEMFKAAGLDPVGITLGEDAQVCRSKGLHVVEMDMAFLDFEDAQFDLVWCRHALEHSIFPFFTLTEIHRVLKPGGALYVEVPAPDTACQHQKNPNHYSVLGKSMWVELIHRAGFQKIEHFELNIPARAGQDFYWAFLMQKPA